MTTYNQSLYTYNQIGVVYDQPIVQRTASGSGSGTQTASGKLYNPQRAASGTGSGTSTAATKASRTRLGYLIDYHTGFYGNGGRFYLGAPIFVRSASGSGVGTQTANRLVTTIRTATGNGTGTSNNSIKLGILRTGYGSGGATTGDTATIFVIKVRSATGSGIGGSAVSYIELLPRTATGSGQGTATTTILRIVPRIATNAGSGGSSSVKILVAIRTATGSGAGTAAVVGSRVTRRTGTNTGLGTATADWVKSHILRLPATDEYPGGLFNYEGTSNRLGSYNRSGRRARNLYKLTDGTYTTVEQRDQGQVVLVYLGSHNNFLSDTEVSELTAAGYGSYIT